MQNITTAKQLGKMVGYVDEEFFKFAKQANLSGDVMQQYKEYIDSASSATFKFGAALKSAAANIGIMLAISLVIKAVTTAWDAMNVTVEEVQSKIDDLNSSLNELNAEYEELNSRDPDSLSSSEQKRLEYLENRIELEQRLLDIEQNRLNEEKVGRGFTDFFDKDSFYRQATDKKFQQGFGGFFSAVGDLFSGGGSDNEYVLKWNADGSIGSYRSLSDEIERLRGLQQGLNEDSSQYINLQWEIDENQKSLDKTISDLQEQSQDLYAGITWYEAKIAEAEDIINDPTSTSNTVEEAKNWIVYYQAQLDSLQRYYDNINEILSSPVEVEKALDEKLSNISVDDLKEAGFTDEELQLLNIQPNIDSEATVEDLRNLLDELQAKANSDPVEVAVKTDIERLSMVEALSTGLDQIDKIYADVLNGEDFDWSSILNNEDFTNTFGELGSAYDEFVETISNNPDDIEACQEAFDNLATEYINSTDALKNLNDETKDATIAFLEQKGVVNAEEIVAAQLARQHSILAAEEEYLTATSENLADATYEDIEQFLGMGNASAEANVYLNELLLTKMDLANLVLDNSADVDAIIGIAEAAGTSKGYVDALRTALTNLMNAQANVSNAQASYNKAKKDTSKFKENSFLGGVLGSATSVAIAKAEEKALEGQVQLALDKALAHIGNVNIDAAQFYGGSATRSARDQMAKDAKSASDAAKQTEKQYNWIEIAIQRVQRVITNLGKTVSDTYKKWSTRNSALSSEMQEVYNEISLQQRAYEGYMNAANAVGLSEHYKSLVQSGAINIETITDENLQNQIDEYQKWYEAALDCSDAIQDLKQNIADLAQQDFDLISSDYESQLSLIEKNANLIDAQISKTETQGYLVSAQYYEMLSKIETENLAMLQRERDALKQSMAEALQTGEIDESSEAFRNMKGELLDVEQAIIESSESLIEFQKTIRELDWEVFDRLQDTISQITEEADFLIELFDEDKLFDDHGNFTDTGWAAVGLHGVDYNAYMNQADKYAKELLEIESELAKDPYDTELIERKYELLEAQREVISAAEDEKDAMVDLVREGIEIQLNALQELIDKRKEALQSEKDLYDYQKTVAEQTKNIADIQKQLEVYRGDTSEETRAQIQQLKVSLEEAQANLEETEYEKYISDQQQMLDDLYLQYEEILNMRLDNIDALIASLLDQVNASSSDIANTINEATDKVGYTLTTEMQNIWNTSSKSITDVLTMYGTDFTGKLTTLNDTINGISTMIKQMVDHSNSTASENISNVNNAVNSVPTTPTTTPPASNTSNSSSSTSSGDSGGGNSSWGSWFVSKKDYYPKGSLRKEISIVDRLKYHDFDSSFSRRREYYAAMGGSGTYTGSSSQNTWMINQMKAHGFKKGGTIGKLIKTTGEDGFILARTGEAILSTEQVASLENLLKNYVNPIINNGIPSYSNAPISKVSNNNINVKIGDVTVKSDSPREFAEQMKNVVNNDRTIRSLMQDVTIGEALGRNRLTRNIR